MHMGIYYMAKKTLQISGENKELVSCISENFFGNINFIPNIHVFPLT